MPKYSNNILVPSRQCGKTQMQKIDVLAQIPEVKALLDENARLRAALESIITYNRDHAEDHYGDPDKAEVWACVKIAREALKGE